MQLSTSCKSILDVIILKLMLYNSGWYSKKYDKYIMNYYVITIYKLIIIVLEKYSTKY